MRPTVFEDLAALAGAPPLDLGVTDWITIEPAMVSAFERSTGVGHEGVVAGGGQGPPGDDARAAPPLLILSLTNRLLPELLQVPGAATGVNYGAVSVRFHDFVPAGSRVRASASIIEAAVVPGGVQTTVRIAVEVEGGTGPVCVVDSLSRWLR